MNGSRSDSTTLVALRRPNKQSTHMCPQLSNNFVLTVRYSRLAQDLPRHLPQTLQERVARGTREPAIVLRDRQALLG